MTPDIEMALDDWRDFNASESRWAKFEAAQFKYERRVWIEWGYILTNGLKEQAIQTIEYSLEKDGTVTRTRITHR